MAKLGRRFDRLHAKRHIKPALSSAWPVLAYIRGSLLVAMQGMDAKALDREIPQVARDPKALAQAEAEVRTLQTKHRLVLGDARELEFIPPGSVHLVVTSPPYWNLKEYEDHEDQMGHIDDYERFLNELDKVWQGCYHALAEGGRMAVVVGDVCLSRRENGRHEVVPLHADIQVRCRKMGFENLAPIIWHKIANAKFEAEGNGAGYLGKPFEPNGVVKNDVEYILLLRKPKSYRRPTVDQRRLSIISADNFGKWFRQIWDVKGESTRDHPAPYPEELAERLVRMFSFVGDTVLDPFSGTGTTMVAACRWGRNSIGIEIVPEYAAYAEKRMTAARSNLVQRQDFKFLRETAAEPLFQVASHA
jgi:DNA modification methylase